MTMSLTRMTTTTTGGSTMLIRWWGVHRNLTSVGLFNPTSAPQYAWTKSADTTWLTARDGGIGGNGRGATAPASPIAPCAVVHRRIDKFVVHPILGMLLLLLLLHLIRPLPCKAMSDGQCQGQAGQAQQRRNVGLANGGGTHEDYDQRMVSMSLMRLLLLPWQMSGWSMTSMLCLDVIVMWIQRQCISHRGQPRTMLSHQRLVHCQCCAAVEAGRQGWGEEDGSGSDGSSFDKWQQQLQEWQRHLILPIREEVPCARSSPRQYDHATATTTATMMTTTMWMT
jgi:hypothetical protein